MENYSIESAKESRIRRINSRFEATQTINPVTGQPYLEEYMNPTKVKRLEDPLQAHLRAMEERKPSANKHRRGLLENIAGRLSLIDRALQYKKGLILIYKVSDVKTPYDLFGNYKIYDKSIKFSLEEIIKTYNKEIIKKFENNEDKNLYQK